jgi:hypothetical protein
MWCFSVNIFEFPDEVKFREPGFIGDIAEVDLFRIAGIYEEFCLNQPSVKVYFRVLFICHPNKYKENPPRVPFRPLADGFIDCQAVKRN